jgi:hypothetical protein
MLQITGYQSDAADQRIYSDQGNGVLQGLVEESMQRFVVFLMNCEYNFSRFGASLATRSLRAW